jgi:hypothetical protein
MVLHMTETMLELVGAAIDRLDAEQQWAGIEKMGGYYVTAESSAIPSSMKVMAIVGKGGTKYAVCVNIVEYLDGLDDSQWQTPWGAKNGN